MKKRILCVILSLAAVFSLIGFNATEAWFSDGENKGLELKAGNLDFSASGNIALKDKEAVVLPGTTLDLEEAIVITNNSTIDTELRIRVECVKEDGTVNEIPWIQFEIEGDDNWVEEDGYIYYRPNGNGRIPAPVITETTTEQVVAAADETTSRVYASNEIPFAGTMIISGEVPPEYNGKTMSVNFVLQAKQAEFMEWTDFVSASETETTTETAAS